MSVRQTAWTPWLLSWWHTTGGPYGMICYLMYIYVVQTFINLLCMCSTEIDSTRADAEEYWTNFACSGDGYKIYPGVQRVVHYACIHTYIHTHTLKHMLPIRWPHRVGVSGRPFVLGDPPYPRAPLPGEAVGGRVRGWDVGHRCEKWIRLHLLQVHPGRYRWPTAWCMFYVTCVLLS